MRRSDQLATVPPPPPGGLSGLVLLLRSLRIWVEHVSHRCLRKRGIASKVVPKGTKEIGPITLTGPRTWFGILFDALILGFLVKLRYPPVGQGVGSVSLMYE